jgi:peroxiredoxin Q/BCP
MAQLRRDYSKFIERGAEIVVVGPENAQAFANYWSRERLPFVGLPDPQASVLKLYGQEVNLLKMGRMPAQVLVDKSGTARLAHYGRSMSDFPSNEEWLDRLDELNAEHHSSFSPSLSAAATSRAARPATPPVDPARSL